MNSLTIKPLADGKPERLYYIDWLRMLAVLGVFLVHSGNMFDMLYRPVKSAISSVGASGITASGGIYFINFFPEWAMSLVFLLSGASTWFALRKRTSRQFITERLTRLFLPLVIGIIIIAPFQAYFQAISNSLYHGTLLQFYPFFLQSIRVSWNPEWLGAYLHHLWFLADLFVFSLITLPVCLYLKREAGQSFIHRLADACERQGGFLILVLPIALIQLALRASFPGYQNWSDVFCWLTFYLYGYILFSNPRFGRIIRQQGKMALYVGIVCFLLLLALWPAGVLEPWTQTPNYSIGCLLFQVLDSITTWSWLIVILNAASKWLNVSNNVLAYGNKATLPFYLLHFPVVIVIAYYVLPWHVHILAAFLLISTSSLIVTLALADLLYRGIHGILALFRITSRKPMLGHTTIPTINRGTTRISKRRFLSYPQSVGISFPHFPQSKRRFLRPMNRKLPTSVSAIYEGG